MNKRVLVIVAALVVAVSAVVFAVVSQHHSHSNSSSVTYGEASNGRSGSGKTNSTSKSTTPAATPTPSSGSSPVATPFDPPGVEELQAPDASDESGDGTAAQPPDETENTSAAQAAAVAFVEEWVPINTGDSASLATRIDTLQNMVAPTSGLASKTSELAQGYPGYADKTVDIQPLTGVSVVPDGTASDGNWDYYVTAQYQGNYTFDGITQPFYGTGDWTVELPPNTGASQLVQKVSENLPNFGIPTAQNPS